VYRYFCPEVAAIEREWPVGRHNPWRGRETPIDVFPCYKAPFKEAAK
jgi:hypothetical protein